MKWQGFFVLAGAAILAVGIAVSPIGHTGAQTVETVVETAPAAAPAEFEREVPQSEAEIQLSFAPVVRRVTPSVVNVYATRIEQRADSPFAGDPFFERFFGGNSPLFRSRPRQSQSLGSGVIVDPSGVVLTNSHVVSGATDIRVALADRREYAVDLVLDDPQTDLAVLRLREAPSDGLPAIAFADSDGLEVGDLVLAVGNPFGVGQTVTSGIVSALARTGVEATDYEFFIQTDAAINPGNSGGALVDLAGRLVGINTAIYTRTGGSVGIGFAIPSNMARLVAEAGGSGEALVRPWLGAKLQPVDAGIASGLQLTTPSGALVTETAPDGPAQRAGLEPGDVITAMDGARVDDPAALTFRLATRPAGSEVRLAVSRRGETVELVLPVEAPPVPEPDEIAEISGNTRFAGARAQQLAPPLAQELGLPYDAQGVAITTVAAGSPAANMGLVAGDVILALNGVEVTDAQTFRELASQRVRTWEIVMQRNGQVLRTYVSG